MKDRRVSERRSLISKSSLSGMERQGHVPVAELRRIPDRRLNNITVEFISIDDFYLTSIHNAYHS